MSVPGLIFPAIGDKRHAVPAFPDAEFEPEQIAVLPMSVFEGILPAVLNMPPLSLVKITSVLSVKAILLQALHDLADHPVQFMDEVAIESALAGAFETRRRGERVVNIRGRQVEEEGLLLCFRDPFYRSSRSAGSGSFIVVDFVGFLGAPKTCWEFCSRLHAGMLVFSNRAGLPKTMGSSGS